MSGETEANGTACKDELSGRAQDLFEARDFAACISTLRQLTKERTTDRKVAHNLAVAEFFLSNQSNTRALGDSLAKCVAAHAATPAQDPEDEAENAYLIYNLAVVRYQNRQYSEALVLLERMFAVIDAVEESIAHSICFLLLDIYLLFFLPGKAEAVLTHMGKAINGGAGDGKKGEDGAEDRNAADDDESAVATAPLNDQDQLKFLLHQYKVRVHLLARAMKPCKREIKSALNLASQNVPALFLKASYEYLRTNYRKSIKLLNSCPFASDLPVAGQLPSVLYFNNLGCIHLQMNKLAAASYYFTKALAANDAAFPEPAKTTGGGKAQNATQGPGSGSACAVTADRRHEVLYNQGLVYLSSGNARLAHQCFKLALDAMYRSPRVWLRLAECCVLLHHQQSQPGRSEGSQQDDVVAHVVGSGVHRKVAVVWPHVPSPHLAAAGQLSLDSAVSYLSTCLHILGEMKARASPAVAPAGTASTGATRSSSSSPASSRSASAATSTSTTGAAAQRVFLPCEAGLVPGTLAAPLSVADIAALRAQALTVLSYCQLGLGRAGKALEAAEQVLDDASAPSSLRFYAHVYAAEALVLAGRTDDALAHLAPQHVDALFAAANPRVPGGDAEEGAQARGGSGVQGWQQPVCAPLLDAAGARAVLLLNMGSVYAVRGEHDRALACVREAEKLGPTAAGGDISKRCLLLAAYIEVRRGNHAEALAVVRRARSSPL